MLIRDMESGRIFSARLDNGKDIIVQVAHLAEQKAVKTGFFNAIGSFSQAALGYYDQVSRKYCTIPVEMPVELACCSGNISLLNGRPFVHAHAVLSDRTGRTWSGHLSCGTVFAAEVYLQEFCGRPLQRFPDPVTGLNLWGEE
jgi:hypothetical protein